MWDVQALQEPFQHRNITMDLYPNCCILDSLLTFSVVRHGSSVIAVNFLVFPLCTPAAPPLSFASVPLCLVGSPALIAEILLSCPDPNPTVFVKLSWFLSALPPHQKPP